LVGTCTLQGQFSAKLSAFLATAGILSSISLDAVLPLELDELFCFGLCPMMSFVLVMNVKLPGFLTRHQPVGSLVK
jgi:hypothetical protein